MQGYDRIYDTFQSLVEPTAATGAYMVATGNHDVSCTVLTDVGCPEALRNFSAYRHRYRMPSAESNASSTAHFNMWYSFRVGRVHFAAVTTETDFPHSPTSPNTVFGGGAGGGFGDQLAWLDRDLGAAAADPSVHWIVVFGHRPWYASKVRDWPFRAPEHVRAAFEPLFEKHHVDLYISGHKHYYERTPKVVRGVPDPRGTMHIINGAAGCNEGHDHGTGVGGLIVAANYTEMGFGVLSLSSSSTASSSTSRASPPALRWRYYLSATHQLYDEVSLPPRAPGYKAMAIEAVPRA